MRERAAATVFMWIALAISISLILGSLKYTTMVASPIDSTKLIEQIVLVPEAWQIGAAILIFTLILAAMGGTFVIWEKATQKEDTARVQTEKAKRDNRDARIK